MKLNRYVGLTVVVALPFIVLMLLFAMLVGSVTLVQGDVTGEFKLAALIAVFVSVGYLLVIVPLLKVIAHKSNWASVVFTRNSITFGKHTYRLDQITICYRKINIGNYLSFCPGLMRLDERNGQSSDVEIGCFTMRDVKKLINELGIEIIII